jgi:benzoylformate decarboxylase
MANVREVLFDLLRELKMTTIFGNIGSTEEPMLKNFPDDFRYILSLHEAVSVAIADAYSQATGEAVHVNLHTAAGSGNAMGNIETAWYNRTPMIITAGQQTRKMLLLEPLLTNKNPLLQAAPWVKWSYEPALAEDVPAAFMRAYATAVQAPAGPVYLSLPMDDMDKECPLVPAKRIIERRLSAGEDILAPVAEALTNSNNPMLIFGGAVDQSDGWDSAVALAEKLNCEVWAGPFEGRPGFPENHPLYQGALVPAIEPICKKMEGHDLVIVIGAPVFRYYPYAAGDYLPKGTRLIHITDSAEESARAPVGDCYVADPARACTMLAKLVPQSKRKAPAPIAPLEIPKAGETITPDYLFYAISKLRADDSIITHESLSNAASLKNHLPTKRTRSFFSLFSGVLGYGLPAAIGVALAEKDRGGKRKVIALQGDGATQYVIQSFWNAAKEDLNILFIILKNREYNILKSYGKYLDAQGVPALNITGIDTVMLAKGYGCEGSYVSKPDQLEDALKTALSHQGPFVLQVEVDPASPPLLGKDGPKKQKES